MFVKISLLSTLLPVCKRKQLFSFGSTKTLEKLPPCTRYFFSFFMFLLYIYNLHSLSCQEKLSRFSMLPIPCNGTSLAVSHWKLRMVHIDGYRSSRLNQNKPFSGPVLTLLSSSAEFYSFSLSGHLRTVGLIAFYSMSQLFIYHKLTITCIILS